MTGRRRGRPRKRSPPHLRRRWKTPAARASDLPVVEEPVESSKTEGAAHLPPLALNSLATTTEESGTSGGADSSAEGRAPESTDPSVDARRPFTGSMTAPPKARPEGRTGAGANFRRSGRHMKAAGKNIGSGVKHFGVASTKSAVWSGKKAGSGVKRFGKAVKGIFD